MKQIKQKLQAKLKNTPGDTSLVPCSVNSGLNREETLSVQSKVRTCNNPEENQPEYTRGPKANYVYVLSIKG